MALLFLLKPFIAYSQNSIGIIAHRDNRIIKLRWAPGNYEAWIQGLKYGYILEKYEINLSDSLNTFINKEIHNDEIFKRADESLWRVLCNHKDPVTERYASIAAQAIFGKEYVINTSISNSIISIKNQSLEQQNRFSYALFSADQCWEVAKALGLGVTDTLVNPTKSYFYRVYLNIPSEFSSKQDTASVLVKEEQYYELPKPMHFKVEFQDKSAKAQWNHTNQKKFYTSYILERSIVNSPFKPVTEIPIVPVLNDDPKNHNFIFFDTLPNNYQLITYRLKGNTPFGKTGPYTEKVEGKGIPEFSSAPVISDYKIIDGSVKLKWDFSKNYKDIRAYKLYRSSSIKGGYQLICDSINCSAQTFIDTEPGFSNYYIIEAIGKDSSSVKSIPKFIQLIDSLPPPPPSEVMGSIDTLGNVIVSWSANGENDIKGYRVYRSNFRTHEFSQITVSPIQDTVFYDYIKVETLTDSVYYKIQATDYRYNNSTFSKTIAMERPDKISPIPPVFVQIKNTENGIMLFWKKSSSKDVIRQVLYKKTVSDSLWHLVADFDISIETYLDTSTHYDIYEYTIIAKDDNGNESTPAKPVIGQRLIQRKSSGINKLTVEPGRDEGCIVLYWNNPKTNSGQIAIYRAVNEEPLSWYKTINAGSNEFIDRNVKIGNRYRYGILMQAHEQKNLITSKGIIY